MIRAVTLYRLSQVISVKLNSGIPKIICYRNPNKINTEVNSSNKVFGSSYHSVNSPSKMSSPPKIMRFEERLVWIDLEMTGLNVDKERIMEAAVIVTDSNLDIVKEGPHIIIKVDDETLDNMGDWCKKHHGQSGLTEACRQSNISLESAEDKILQFVSQHTEAGKAPLAGNSVHADKTFLQKYMPRLMKHLHYRIVDVSTVKELCRRWYPEDFQSAPAKKTTHRALDDILESIEELKYYRKSIFKEAN